MKILDEIKKLDKRKKTYFAIALSLVVVLLWAFISAGVITANFNREQLVGKQDRKELDVEGIILTETKDGQKFWEIYGETGTYNSENMVALLDNTTGNFYKNNEVSMSFESSKGTYNEVKKQIILYDNTYIVLKDGITLNCDRLIYSGNDVDIVAEGNIKIKKGKEFFATADTVLISPDYSRFKIKGHAISKLYDLKEKK